MRIICSRLPNRICWTVFSDEIEEFIAGVRHRLDPDRVLATVMFTDIVRSTERAAEMGDSRWRNLLTDFYAAVRKELSVFHGREVNTAGDGLLATFDGPNRPIRCACSVREKLRPLGLEVRTGLHSGECELIGDVSAVSRCISRRASWLLPNRTKCWCPARSGTWSPVPDCGSPPGHAFTKRRARGMASVPGSVTHRQSPTIPDAMRPHRARGALSLNTDRRFSALRVSWCRGRDSNPHGDCPPENFKFYGIPSASVQT